jgi:hypothetical protein
MLLHSETTNRQTQVQYRYYGIVQSGSRFNSTIRLGENASLDQGNTFDGNPYESFRQDGSEFEGDIQGGKSVKLSQGNKINGHKAEASENNSADES